MPYDPAIHHRRSIRLPEYDYASSGAYFVTLCTQNRVCLLEDSVIAGIISAVWHALIHWFPTIELDDFVLMPNHIHFIVWLQSTTVGTTLAVAQYGQGQARPLQSDADHHPPAGATLAVAQWSEAAQWAGAHHVARRCADTGSPALTDWIIPQAEKVNLHPTLGDVVGTFKSLVFTVYLDWIETQRLDRRAKFWHKNYYEHVIRNELELNAIRQYIRDNPRCWAEDRDNADNAKHLPLPSRVEDYLEDIEPLMAANNLQVNSV